MTLDEMGRRILTVIHDNQPNPGISVQDSLIAEKIGLPLQEVKDRLELLEEDELVELAKTTGGYGAWLTAQGRLSLQDRPERRAVAAMTITSPEAIQRKPDTHALRGT